MKYTLMFNIFTRISLHTASFVSRLVLFFNGGPTLFARKPVLLLVCHLLQHKLRFVAPVALEFANFVGVHDYVICMH
jgi:hypothetical protein